MAAPRRDLSDERGRVAFTAPQRWATASRLVTHVLVLEGHVIDPATRRRDPVGDLARFRDAVHEGVDIRAVFVCRQPFGFFCFPRLLGYELATRGHIVVGVDTLSSMKSNAGQRNVILVSEACLSDDSVPLCKNSLTVRYVFAS